MDPNLPPIPPKSASQLIKSQLNIPPSSRSKNRILAPQAEGSSVSALPWNSQRNESRISVRLLAATHAWLHAHDFMPPWCIKERREERRVSRQREEEIRQRFVNEKLVKTEGRNRERERQASVSRDRQLPAETAIGIARERERERKRAVERRRGVEAEGDRPNVANEGQRGRTGARGCETRTGRGRRRSVAARSRERCGREGGRERWQQEEYARALPVAHDAHTERVYEASVERGLAAPYQPAQNTLSRIGEKRRDYRGGDFALVRKSKPGWISLSLGEFSASAHRRSVFRRVEEWSWATRCATGTPLCWEIRRMGTSMTSRRSVPAGEVFDVSVLTARRRVERGLGKGDAGECPVLMLEGEGGCIEDA